MQKINGRFERKDLDRLGWPIAWDGTATGDALADRQAYEARLSEVRTAAKRALDEADGAIAVEIVDDEIVSVEIG